MSRVLFLLSVCSVAMATEWSSFMNFVKFYNKEYQSLEHFTSKFHTFVENAKFIREYNSQSNCLEECIPANVTLEENYFMDLSSDEFKKFNGLETPVKSASCSPFSSTGILPSSVDWRKEFRKFKHMY